MATVEQPEKQPNDNWRPPRGIRYETRDDRPAPFFLHWRTEGGERKAQAFATEQERARVAFDLAEKRRRLGTAILDVAPSEWATWVEFRRRIGNADPLRVADEWLLSRQPGTGRLGMTVLQAWTQYRAMRMKEDRLAADTWRHIDAHLADRFVPQFAEHSVADITAGDIRAWLDALTNPRTGGPFDLLTRRHHLKSVKTFFDRAVREQWVARNPCDLVALPTPPPQDVTVISAKDAATYFANNAGRPFLVRLALEAFGGVRYSTAGRIGWANIDFAGRGIEMPAPLHKSGKRRFRQGHPETLWAWLDLAKDKTHPAWALTLRQYAEEKKAGRIRAGVETPHNVWRHSFASYLLALRKNMGEVAYLMQHRHTTTTEIYEGVAREVDAKAYFAIRPT